MSVLLSTRLSKQCLPSNQTCSLLSKLFQTPSKRTAGLLYSTNQLPVYPCFRSIQWTKDNSKVSTDKGLRVIQQWRSYAHTPRENEEKSASGSPVPDKPSVVIREKIKALSTHEQIYNLPNFLTFTRLIAAPVCGYLVLHGQHTAAVLLFAYAGITDFVDGYLARKWKLQTVVGSVVDPMADKLLMTVLVGSLAATGALPLPLAIIILGRDVSLAIAAIYYRYASLPKPKTLARYWDFSLPSAEVHPTTLSKYNTFLQLVLIGYTLVLPVLPAPPELIATTALSPLRALLDSLNISAGPVGSYHPFTKIFQLLVAGTTLWTGFSYAFLKKAVTILGEDEVLKAKQGRRGRGIIGVTYFAFVAVAGWLWVNRHDEKSEIDIQGSEKT